MDSPYPIRVGAAADVPQLCAAYEWLFAPPGGRPPDWDPGTAAGRLARLVTDAGATMLVAGVGPGGPIVGFCSVYLDIESVRYGRRAWVEDLAVHPDLRSQGIGRRLLEGARAWARERGASHLELDSGDARSDAHRFYRREGPDATSACFSWRL